MLDDFKPVRRERQARDKNVHPPASKTKSTTAPKSQPKADPVSFDVPLLAAHNRRIGFVGHIADIRYWRPTKKQLIIGIPVLLLLIGGGTAAALTLFRKPVEQPVVIHKEEPKVEPPPPTTEPSKLTGVEVEIEKNKLPVTGVMIENSPDARPQSGLKDAGIVYEAIAEGGITRFLALYQTEIPEYVGPVRSVRPYYLDFVVPFDAPLAHVGGSAVALQQIRTEGIKDLDQSFNPAQYQRVSNRFAPHNMYTNRQALLDLQISKGWGTSQFTSFLRKPESKAAAPDATSIDFTISGSLYNPHFDYNPVQNSYNRSMAGKPHFDERANSQISPKVVIALVIPHSYAGIYSVYQTAGSGEMFVFQDGTATKGVWSKLDRKSQFEFKAENGEPLKLNAGQTWITVVGLSGSVRF